MFSFENRCRQFRERTLYLFTCVVLLLAGKQRFLTAPKSNVSFRLSGQILIFTKTAQKSHGLRIQEWIVDRVSQPKSNFEITNHSKCLPPEHSHLDSKAHRVSDKRLIGLLILFAGPIVLVWLFWTNRSLKWSRSTAISIKQFTKTQTTW